MQACHRRAWRLHTASPAIVPSGQLLGATLRANRVGLEQPGAFDDERLRTHRISLVAQYELRLAGEVGLTEGDPSADTSVPSATIWSPAATRTASPTTTSSTGTRTSLPSRTTTALGATNAASRSSSRLERISWNEPIAMFATTIPRNSASRHESNTSVMIAKTTRITFGMVNAFARTMLA